MEKKGFTLIELLAVIVILSIIALISVPIVLNMIESSKKSGAKSSAYGYIEAIEYNNGLSEIENSGYIKVEDGIKEVNSIIGLKMKGKAPEFGEVNIEKGKVKSATLCINGYEVKYKNKDATITGKCDVSNIIKLEKISVTEDKIILDIDGTYQIEPIFEPENATYKNITYEVKDSSIITVSSTGLITGIKEGNTTITIKGSNNKSSIINIEVKKSNAIVFLAGRFGTCYNGAKNDTLQEVDNEILKSAYTQLVDESYDKVCDYNPLLIGADRYLKFEVKRKVKVTFYGRGYSDNAGSSGKDAIIKKYNGSNLEDFITVSFKENLNIDEHGTAHVYNPQIFEPGIYQITADRYFTSSEWKIEKVD